jgi:hypothetical protein
MALQVHGPTSEAVHRQAAAEPIPVTLVSDPYAELTLSTTSRGDGVNEIHTLYDQIGFNILQTQININVAIENFTRDQTFETTPAGAADYSGTVFKHTIGKIKDFVTAKGLKSIGGGADKIYDFTFGLLDAIEKETERAASARESRKVADYLNLLAQGASRTFENRLKALPQLMEQTADEYESSLAAQRPSKSAKGVASRNAVISGEPARLIRDLRAFREAMSAPSSLLVQQFLVEGWVNTALGGAGYGVGKSVFSGMILVRLDMEKDGETYEFTSRASAQLHAPRSKEVIESIRTLFDPAPQFAEDKNRPRSIEDLDILKLARIRVEDETWGLNNWYDVMIKYRSRDKIEDVYTLPHPAHRTTAETAASIERDVLKIVMTQWDFLFTIKKLTPAGDG